MGNLGAVLPIVHEQELEVLDVADGELQKTVWKNVPGLLVGSITDVWLWPDAPELSPLPSVDTSGVAPALLDGDLPVGLVSLELASKFLFCREETEERKGTSQKTGARERRRKDLGTERGPKSRARGKGE